MIFHRNDVTFSSFHRKRVQRYYKKCIYARKARKNCKNNRFYLFILILSSYKSLLIIVDKSDYNKAEPNFYNISSDLEYIQHFATVASRWARIARSVPSKYYKKKHPTEDTTFSFNARTQSAFTQIFGEKVYFLR